jgi:hypothetical protein
LKASLGYLDNEPTVARYAYFGSFRTTKSTVGPNVPMLDASGGLTNIGKIYLGKTSTTGTPTSPNVAGAWRADWAMALGAAAAALAILLL